jgi:DNA-binding NarL/FixJ family response regulator
LQEAGPSSRGLPLTVREKEIITLIAQGFTSKEIAAKLYISVATVETHRTNLMTKLAGLVSYAFRTGLVKPGSNGQYLCGRPDGSVIR